MVLWQLFLVLGLACLIFEIFFPTTFFLNFAIGGFLTAIISVFYQNINVLIGIFAVVSVFCLILFRPFLAKQMKNKNQQTGLEGQYIGKIVKVIEPVNKFSGAITIYGERWEARSDDEIAVNSEAKIVQNDSLIMYIEKV